VGVSQSIETASKWLKKAEAQGMKMATAVMKKYCIR
jgi:hypothetical protein